MKYLRFKLAWWYWFLIEQKLYPEGSLSSEMFWKQSRKSRRIIIDREYERWKAREPVWETYRTGSTVIAPVDTTDPPDIHSMR
jgi:hypothetical protein